MSVVVERGFVSVYNGSGKTLILRAPASLIEDVERQGNTVMVRTKAGFVLLVRGSMFRWLRPKQG